MSIIEEALNKKEKNEKKTDFTLLKERKSNKKKWILISILFILILASGIFYFYANFISITPNRKAKVKKFVKKYKNVEVSTNNLQENKIKKDKKTKKTIEKEQKTTIVLKNENSKKNIDNHTFNRIIHNVHKKNLNIVKTSSTKINKTQNNIKKTTKRVIQKTQLSKKNLIEELLLKAYKNLKAGNILQAVSLYSKVLKLDKSSEEALINRAIAYQKLNEFSKAEKDLLTALKYSKNKGYIYNVLGVLYMKQNKNDKAINFFKKSKTSESYVNMALIYWKENKIEDVYKNLSNAIAIDPQNGYAHLYLGIFLKQLGEKEKANKEFERASIIAKEKGDLNLLKILSKYY